MLREGRNPSLINSLIVKNRWNFAYISQRSPSYTYVPLREALLRVQDSSCALHADRGALRNHLAESELRVQKERYNSRLEVEMALAATRPDTGVDLAARAREATIATEALLADATRAIAARVTQGGRIAGKLLDREQRAAHGLAWFATYVQAVRQLGAYAQRMSEAGRFGETEELLVRIGLGEYLAQMLGGIPMSQANSCGRAIWGCRPRR